jgi:hypothetical protein
MRATTSPLRNGFEEEAVTLAIRVNACSGRRPMSAANKYRPGRSSAYDGVPTFVR